MDQEKRSDPLPDLNPFPDLTTFVTFLTVSTLSLELGI
jgi:hypothetical protein